MVLQFPDRFIKLLDHDGPNEELIQLIHDTTGSMEQVEVSSLKGGITNQLSLVQQGAKKMLVRSFGRGTDSFIDRDREYAVHRRLMELDMAPELYCRFGNGLVYAYVEGRTVDYEELSHADVMASVASRLGQWHALLHKSDVEKLLPTQETGNLRDLLMKWIRIVPEGVLPVTKEQLFAEYEYLLDKLMPKSGLNVMGHCDLLSGNILVPQDWATDASTQGLMPQTPYVPNHMATFIDYEYSLPCPRAFDIANHFMEWQGFDCKFELVPKPSISDPKLKFWLSHYLSSFAHFSGRPADSIETLIEELNWWWGVPGFYWAVWGALQSTISEIDFDYNWYARKRFEEYMDWKTRFLKN